MPLAHTELIPGQKSDSGRSGRIRNEKRALRKVTQNHLRRRARIEMRPGKERQISTQDIKEAATESMVRGLP